MVIASRVVVHVLSRAAGAAMNRAYERINGCGMGLWDTELGVWDNNGDGIDGVVA
jgi:hypothetical protein